MTVASDRQSLGRSWQWMTAQCDTERRFGGPRNSRRVQGAWHRATRKPTRPSGGRRPDQGIRVPAAKIHPLPTRRRPEVGRKARSTGRRSGADTPSTWHQARNGHFACAPAWAAWRAGRDGSRSGDHWHSQARLGGRARQRVATRTPDRSPSGRSASEAAWTGRLRPASQL